MISLKEQCKDTIPALTVRDVVFLSEYFFPDFMIIKQADEKQSQIAYLTDLLAHPEADSITRKKIEREIRLIRAGMKGEAEAAYEMQFHWGNSKNWMILNDLRIEHDGLVAQIDHLLINRFLYIWVCESKHFADGITINEHGEFQAFFGNKAYGIPSPVEQNNRHILFLERLFNSGTVRLPTRLGFPIRPALKSLVLVSRGARITRPKTAIDGLSTIIKNDQLFKTIDKMLDENNPLLLTKLIGQDTLEELAREIAGQHKPLEFDWAARFGLSEVGRVCGSASQKDAVPEAESGGVTTVVAEPIKEYGAPAASPPASTKQHTCSACSAEVTDKVVRFCLGNVSRFGGQVYCMACQKRVSSAGVRSAEPALKQLRQRRICHSCGVPLTYSVAKFCWTNKSRFNGFLYCMDCQKTV